MTTTEMHVSGIDREALRRRLLTALAANRVPGFHFPGYFLEMSWPRRDDTTIDQAMTAGPHCLDADGALDAVAMGLLIDGALAMAPRLVIEPGARMATVHLDVQYTGHEPRGHLCMEGTMEGFFASNAVRQALARGVLVSEGQPVCYASGSFVVLPAPPGVQLAPLPWQRTDDSPVVPLEPRDLDAKEKGVMRAADAALKRAGEYAFIKHFWGILPKATPGGATCRVKISPQIGNRVGHVQGGVLLGLAQATASAAVPDHPVMSSISAWYISPGQGKALGVRSKIVHAGRSFAVVRTEVKNADGTRVLEAVSNHAAR